MKILAFNGSSHKDGNTASLLKEYLKGAESSSANTKMYNLYDLSYNDCVGCNGCKSMEDKAKCAQKDDLKNIYDEIYDADHIVIGSPVYMWQMNGRTKDFVDRFLPFLKQDYSSRIKGKKLSLLFTQGAAEKNAFMNYFNLTKDMFTFMGFDVKDIVVGEAMGFNQESRTRSLKEAFESGKNTVK